MKGQVSFSSHATLSALEIIECWVWLVPYIAEYKAIQDAYKTSDNYANNVCLRVSITNSQNEQMFPQECCWNYLQVAGFMLQAFEHLLEQELIGFTDSKGRTPSIEFRPVKLLISSRELYQGLKSNSSCPVSCFYHF